MSRTTVHVRWAIFNVALALAAALVAVWILGEEQKVRDAIAQLQKKRTRDCAPRVRPAPSPPPAVEVPTQPPPEDQAADGYIGQTGVDITPAMRLKLEAIREPTQEQTELLRLGSQAVLPSRTIHVINLWAPWCGPCRDEMPDFKTLFAQRADWGSSVRFVPIMLKDHTNPIDAYAPMESAMPDAPVKLADRGYQDPLATRLAADNRNLFRGNLPVTLVLDCNRRVRWASFAQLSSRDFQELERYVDQLREELADTSPNAWCSRPWPGNGRCEGLEDTPEHHSLEDCGELKRNPDEPAALPPEDEAIPPPPPPVACPEGTTPTPEGKCKRKLRGNLPRPGPVLEVDKPRSCGNGTCDVAIGENSMTCCQDCPCKEPLVCRVASNGEHTCLVKRLK